MAGPKDHDLDAEFDAFRRDRNFRRQQRAEPLRGLGAEVDVLREIEAAEMEEAQDRQLSSDMQEFFAAAKRKAAGIVRHVTEVAEEETSTRLRDDMEDFLATLIERATNFMHAVRVKTGGGEQNVEPHMHNLVGQLLDEFRSEGTAQLQDKHLGQDPFQTDVDAVAAEFRQIEAQQHDSGVLAPPRVVDPLVEPLPMQSADAPDLEMSDFASAPAQPAPYAMPDPLNEPAPHAEADSEPEPEPEPEPKPRRHPIEDHLVAELHREEAATPPTEEAVHPLIDWLGRDVEKVGAVLRVLVQHDLVSKDEARSVYQALLS